MPITVSAPTGELTPDGEREILPRLTAALLEISGATGNPFLTALIGGSVHVLDAKDVYAGGVNRPVVLVELKLPSVGLPTVEDRATFVRAATEIVAGSTRPGHDPHDTWVNVVTVPDGAWGVGGRAYTDDALVAAIIAADPS